MAQKFLAVRARRLSINFRLGPILALSLAACPAVAQDRDQNHDRAAADRAFAEGARLRKEGKASLPRAIEKYQEALALRRALGDRSGEAEALLQIGDAYNTLGDYRKSLEFWEQALPLKQALGDRRGAADLLASMSAAYNNLGERRKAVECLWRTLTIKRELGDQGREANVLLQIGVIYDDLGEKQRAIECLQQALLLFRKQGDKHAIATLLYRLGLTYDSIYERQKAVECFKEGLELRMAVRHPKGEGVTLNSLGNFYDGLRKEVRDACFHGRLDGSECVITFQAMQTEAADFLTNPFGIVGRAHEKRATIRTIAGDLLGQPGVHSIDTFWTRGHAKAKKQCC